MRLIKRAEKGLTLAAGGLHDVIQSVNKYKPSSFNDLERTYAEVAEELRHQYTLYYSPLNAKRDGQFRRLNVQTINPGEHVTARIGYYAPKK